MEEPHGLSGVGFPVLGCLEFGPDVFLDSGVGVAFKWSCSFGMFWGLPHGPVTRFYKIQAIHFRNPTLGVHVPT